VSRISSKGSAEATAEKRDAPLAIESEAFRAARHDLVDRIAEFLDGLRERPMAPGEAPTEVGAALWSEDALPDEGTELGAPLRESTELLFEQTTQRSPPGETEVARIPPIPGRPASRRPG